MTPGFMVYFEDLENISNLSNSDLGKLIRLLAEFAQGGEPEVPPKLLYPYNFISTKVKRDTDAYEQKVEKRRKAAEARWNTNNAHASDAMQNMQMHDVHSNSNYNSNRNHNHNSNRNQTKPYALDYLQRDDDMNDVLMEV